MVTSKTANKTLTKLVTVVIFSALCSSQLCYADRQTAADNDKFSGFDALKVIKYSKSMKVRGYEISEGIYMGQAKVGGKYGFGFVVDRKVFAWGINNKGISIQKRF